MSAPVYTYRAGVRFQKGASPPAQSVGERLEMLREQNAEQLTPEIVVADARSPGSPLHSFFEWNDFEAAEQYRLHQARNLIHSAFRRRYGELAEFAQLFVTMDELWRVRWSRRRTSSTQTCITDPAVFGMARPARPVLARLGVARLGEAGQGREARPV